ncbi:hypothetical protein RUM43_009597 [Polyplax serrata]|uniref:Large ribosomal subunit protein uL15m n=1 Tax=Polyplax serrata TaxID=468196 RepID=A0AAN8PWN8_POLSC
MTELALTWLRSLPRVALDNMREAPGKKKFERRRGRYGGKTHGTATKSLEQRQAYRLVGYDPKRAPFYLKCQDENYNDGHDVRRQYRPMSLLMLQKLIDTNRLDTSDLIDLTSLCKTGLYQIDPLQREFGVQLNDTGINKFDAKIDIEVQYAPEHVIAAIESKGGSVTLAYYDVQSLLALVNPQKFFESGRPIPKRLLPPDDAIEMYSDPKRRGYMADPQEIEYERGVLAQKYGYELVERKPPMRKDPLQIFLGLEPGWVINLRDKLILKPRDPELLKYYSS